ncbi:hypothetical protein B1810_10815 [Panacagrimonas perspica]|nr:hypothetical protein B1810_10815 [Panacagrimonas perspica]
MPGVLFLGSSLISENIQNCVWHRLRGRTPIDPVRSPGFPSSTERNPGLRPGYEHVRRTRDATHTMTTDSIPSANDLAARRFLSGFIPLALLSGIAVGMTKVLGTLMGIHLGVSHWQLGVIGGAETIAMAAGMLPAGWLLSRGNPRKLYAAVSLFLTGLMLVLPHLRSWQFVAFAMFALGLCMSVRIVAMSTAFMLQLPTIGQSRAGWYKGTLTLGVQFCGPLLGNELVARLGLSWGFAASGALFIVLALIGWGVLPPQGRRDGPAASPLPGSLRELLRIPDVRRSCAFEVLGNMTAISYSTFAILLAVEVLGWELRYGVWLLVSQGLATVAVLLGGGRLLLDPARIDFHQRCGHVLILAGLLLLGTMHWAPAFIAASVFLGLGLGVNGLVNYSRIAQAPVNKARASAQLALSGTMGSAIAAVTAGAIGHVFGLQNIYLVWLLPWLLLMLDWRRLGRWVVARQVPAA